MGKQILFIGETDCLIQLECEQIALYELKIVNSGVLIFESPKMKMDEFKAFIEEQIEKRKLSIKQLTATIQIDTNLKLQEEQRREKNFIRHQNKLRQRFHNKKR